MCLLLAALALFSCTPGNTPDTPPPRKPVTQVVLFTVDTLRADRLGLYGYTHKPTSPNLDAWAENAMVFGKVFAPAPWTVPSVGALMTGFYPVQIGAYTNRGVISDHFVTLAQLFRQHGFKTASFNTHYLLLGDRGGFRRGFDEVFPVVDEPEDETIHKLPFSVTEPQLMNWLSQHANDPFFIWIHDMSPHEPPTEGNPYMTDPAWDRGHDWRRYDPEIRWVDEIAGRLFDQLKALGIWERCLLVFTADHGEAFLEHHLAGHQDVIYDEVLRIPLILQYPGMPSPRHIDAPVELTDLFSTIAELAGLPLPPGVQGESLLPVIENASAPMRNRPAFHARYHFEGGAHHLAVRDGEWKLIVKTPPSKQHIEDRPDWSLYRPGTTFELYNLMRDPRETENLIESHPEVALRLEGKLLAWKRRTDAAAAAQKAGTPPPLDDATREALRALGYEE